MQPEVEIAPLLAGTATVRVLAIGINENDIDAHCLRQENVPLNERLWLVDESNQTGIQLHAYKDGRDLEIAQIDADLADKPNTEVDLDDLMTLVPNTDQIQRHFESAAEKAALDRQLALVDKRIVTDRLTKNLNQLLTAKSAGMVCTLLDDREEITRGDMDEAIAAEIDLQDMPWNVDLCLDWIEISALHYDGNAIVYIDCWNFVDLEILWLKQCDANSVDELSPPEKAQWDAWQAQIENVRAKFGSS